MSNLMQGYGREISSVPVMEGIATLGLATAAELHSAHEFEERTWEQIVHTIDPSLKICQLDGILFKTDQDLNAHIKLHEQQGAQGSMMNQLLMMGMLGGVGMGMFGMGSGFGMGPGFGGMGGGFWI